MIASPTPHHHFPRSSSHPSCRSLGTEVLPVARVCVCAGWFLRHCTATLSGSSVSAEPRGTQRQQRWPAAGGHFRHVDQSHCHWLHGAIRPRVCKVPETFRHRRAPAVLRHRCAAGCCGCRLLWLPIAVVADCCGCRLLWLPIAATLHRSTCLRVTGVCSSLRILC